MKKLEAVKATIQRCRERHLALSTERTYSEWVARYATWLQSSQRAGDLEGYLNHLATQVSISTHHQALNALVFFYKHVLEQEIPSLNLAKAKPSRHLPCWLSANECHRLLAQMTGVPRLQAQLLYGAGLRVGECVSLRVKDIDFDGKAITVRNAKGNVDRVTVLPNLVREDLLEQIERSRALWQEDVNNHVPPPYLPDSLLKKLGRGAAEFAWFWVFPSGKISQCPRSKIRRRHHLTQQGLNHALRQAKRKAQKHPNH